MGRKESVKGKIWLIANLSRINLRTSFITLIGLTIALSMTSAYLIYIDTIRADYYMTLLDEYPFSDRGLNFEIKTQSNTNEKLLPNGSILPLARKYLDDRIEISNMSDVLIHRYSYARIQGSSLSFLNQRSVSSLYCLNLDQTILDDCINGSTIPSLPDEVIVLSSQITNNLSIGDRFNISYVKRISNEYLYTNISLRITGIITPESLTNDSFIDYIIHDDNTVNKLITDNVNYFNLLQLLKDEYEFLTNETVYFSSKLYISYDIDVNRNNIVKIIPDLLLPFLDEFQWSHQYIFPELELYSIRVDYLIYNVDRYNNSFFLTLLIASAPSLLLAYLLVRFSFGLINENRLKALVLLKMRGMSKEFILTVLVTETLIIAVLASFLGTILGLPLVSLLLDSSINFLNFRTSSPVTSFVITPNAILINLTLGFCFTFASHLRPILRLSRSSIVTIDEITSKKKKKRARIFKGNLDLVLLIQGALGVFILGMLLDLSRKNPEITPELFTVALPILIISPLTLLIGVVLSFNRFIPLILQKTSYILLKKDWWLLSTATRNLLVNLKSTGRLTLLIAFSISFLVILSCLPVSMEQYDIEKTYYSFGTDVKIEVGSALPYIDNLTTSLQSIPELKVTRVLDTVHFEVISNRYYVTNYLGVEKNFSHVIHWREYCDDESLNSHVNDLYNSMEEFPIIIDSNTAAKEKLTVNNSYQVKMETSDGIVTINATITGIINRLPGFINSWDADRTYDRTYVMTKYSVLENLSNQYTLDHGMGTSLWCKASTSTDQDIVNQVIQVSESYGIRNSAFRALIDQITPDTSDPMSNTLRIVANFNFLSFLAVIIAIIVLFTFTRIISHKSEVGLSRALGMQYKQMFLLMFAEPMLLFVFSGIPGAIIGELFLIIYAVVMDAVEKGVPFILYYDITTISLIFGSIFFVTVLSGLLMSMMATKANISKILKVE